MKNVFFLIIFFTLVFMFSYLYINEFFNLDQLKNNQISIKLWTNENSIFSRWLFFTLYIAFAGLSVPVAPSVMTIAAGALFGVFEGVILVSFASSLGACICFIISRYFLFDYFNKKFSKKFSLVYKNFKQDGAWYLLSLRLIPTISYILINLIMGVMPISIKKFYFISQIGMLPATIVYVYAGSEISKINQIKDIMSIELLLSFILIASLPIILKFLLKKLKFPT